MSPVFEAEPVPLQYFQAMGTYYKNLSVREAQHTTCASVLCSSGGVEDWCVMRRIVGSVGLPEA